MKKVLAVLLLATLTGCQNLPMHQKESPSGFFATQFSAKQSDGHEFRGYDFPRRHYY
ncbi:MAG: hypothetical protein AAF404_19470 [Pseudomonadota bacterium]